MTPTLRDVLRCTAGICGVKREAILGRSRILPIVRARHVAMYLARELTSASYPVIGRFFGCDHTTALHAYRNVASLVASGDMALIECLNAVKDALNGEPIVAIPTPRAELIREIRAAITTVQTLLAALEAVS